MVYFPAKWLDSEIYKGNTSQTNKSIGITGANTTGNTSIKYYFTFKLILFDLI